MIPSRYPNDTLWVFQESRNNHRCFKNEHFVMLTSLLCSIKVSTNTLCVWKIKQGFASTHGTFVIFGNHLNGFWDFLSVTRVGTVSSTVDSLSQQIQPGKSRLPNGPPLFTPREELLLSIVEWIDLSKRIIKQWSNNKWIKVNPTK